MWQLDEKIEVEESRGTFPLRNFPLGRKSPFLSLFFDLGLPFVIEIRPLFLNWCTYIQIPVSEIGANFSN